MGSRYKTKVGSKNIPIATITSINSFPIGTGVCADTICLGDLTSNIETNFVTKEYLDKKLNEIKPESTPIYTAAKFTPTKSLPKESFGGVIRVFGKDPLYIKEIIYNNPVTVINWSDGTRTIAKCAEEDIYSPEIGLLIAYLKKIIGNDTLRKLLNNWVPEALNDEGPTKITLRDVFKNQ